LSNNLKEIKVQPVFPSPGLRIASIWLQECVVGDRGIKKGVELHKSIMIADEIRAKVQNIKDVPL
jgi:hypothetical protein